MQGIGFIMPPFLNEGGHVFGPGAIEEHPFSRAGMGESERLGVQYLPGTKRKAVLYVLTVFLCAKTFQYFAAPILLIRKKRVTDMFHVHTNLVGSSGLQATFNKCDVWKLLETPPMSNGLFGLRAFLRIPNTIDCAIAVVSG